MPSLVKTSRSPRGATPGPLLLASTLALLLLSACSSNPRREFLPEEPAKRPPPPVLPKPAPVKTEPVQWQVVDLNGEKLFALTGRGFEALMRNLAETVRWAGEASHQIDFYRGQRLPADEVKAEEDRP